MYYKLDIKDFCEDIYGCWSVPIIKIESENTNEMEILHDDCISDSFGIDKDNMCVWFSSRIREDIEDDKSKVEDFFRQYFIGDEVYALFGFIRKMLEK